MDDAADVDVTLYNNRVMVGPRLIPSDVFEVRPGKRGTAGLPANLKHKTRPG